MKAHFLIPAATLLFALGAAGCSSGRGPAARPTAVAAGDPRPLLAEADSAISRGDATAARRALDRALAMAPESASVHIVRGRFFTAIRRYRDAKSELDRAAYLDPRSPEPPYQLGRSYLAAGQEEAARASFLRALALDPAHAGAQAGLSGLLAGRYEAAGIPGDYALLVSKTSISRGELAVILAVELGVDPDRASWRSDDIQRINWPDLERAWGSRWLRASVMRRWIEAYPDGSLHLDDPITRGQLALVLARLIAEGGRDSLAWSPSAAFPDLGPRHYLSRSAYRAVRLGLPLREGGRFEPLASVTGSEALRAVRGLAGSLGATPIVRVGPELKANGKLSE